jgi:tight adherence protein C
MIETFFEGEIPFEFWVMGGALVVMAMMLVFLMIQGRNDVRRRTDFDAPRGSVSKEVVANGQPEVKKLFDVHTFSVDRLVTFVNNATTGGEGSESKVLKAQLLQAGFFSERAVAIYFMIRVGCALALALASYLVIPSFFTVEKTQTLVLFITIGVIVGYLAPGFYLSRKIDQRQTECRMGFPDFMDLMVVCAEAGLSLEASIERIARELSQGYPALAENLYMMSLEVRAGKRVVVAMMRMAERIGIDEALSLATLLKQSCVVG